MCCVCRSIDEDRSTDTSYSITCSIVEIYNEVVHDLLSRDVKRQVELQKTAGGFEIPSITTVGALSAVRILYVYWGQGDTQLFIPKNMVKHRG